MDAVGNSGKVAINRNGILGEGSNGTCVYKGTFEKTVPVAVKRMVYFATTDLKVINNEVTMLKKLDHPNIIRYKLFDKDKDFLYIVLDLCDASLTECIKKGTLNPSWVYLSSEMKTKFKINILKDILSGLGYLHKMDVIHRDLKPQNVLIKKSKFTEYGVTAVITDFGLSLEIKEDQTHVTATEAGTKGWKPKEVLGKGKKHFKKSMDIFAFGCVAQFVLSQSTDASNRFVHPFGAELCRERNIHFGKRVAFIDFPRKSMDREVDLLGDIMVNSCVSNDPKLRPEAKELLDHPLFWSYTEKLHFVEKVFNDYKDKFESDAVKSLEDNWKKYKPAAVEEKIREAWGYHLFCRKLAKQSKPNTKSLFNAVLRNIRNIQQHCREAVARYKEPHKQPNSEAETILEEVLGDCSDEAIGRYFFSRIPALIPIVYLSLYLHARENRVLQRYYKNADTDKTVAEGKTESGWSTLDKLTTRSSRSSTPSSSSRSRSNSKS